ncbi:hypothetical protein B0H16DRAFT_1740964 [Mycena metata]|uniref:F-box domain-containing protein n=1 Tax=Mycena metata TaxID=1033252 RepID=A0AAD7MHB3_9AGAR|nr:hypothetical protein B0H16DRAFT_1740964 [Mycena metata]
MAHNLLIVTDYPAPLQPMPDLESPCDFPTSINLSLPPELLDEVLEIAIGSFEEDLFGHANRRTICMEVDFTWASRIKNNPAMWSDIYINNTTHASMAEFSTCLVNSKGRKLQIYFLAELRPLFSMAMRRCSCLKLSCMGSGVLDLVLSLVSTLPGGVATEMRHLQIESYPPQNGVELRRKFESAFFGHQPLSVYRTAWSFIPCPLASITVLEIKHLYIDIGVTWMQLKGTLESATALQVLHLISVACVVDDLRAEDHPCTLRHLTKLDMVINHPSSDRIARALRLPRLRTLRLKAPHGWWNQNGVGSMPFLSTVVTVVVDAVEDLDDVVHKLPRLQRLQIRRAARSKLLQRLDWDKAAEQADCSSALTAIVSEERLSKEEIASFLHRAGGRIPNKVTLTVPWERWNEVAFVPHCFTEVDGVVVHRATSVVDLFGA